MNSAMKMEGNLSAPIGGGMPSRTEEVRTGNILHALADIDRVPPEQVLGVLRDLAATADRQAITGLETDAITGLETDAIPLANGLRTIVHLIDRVREGSPVPDAAALTLANLASVWFYALVRLRACVNPPEVTRYAIAEGQPADGIRCVWNRGDRTLTVEVEGGAAFYRAMSFDEQKHLEYQEGTLDLSPARMVTTVDWLISA